MLLLGFLNRHLGCEKSDEGRIRELMEDMAVDEIMINAYDRVFIDAHGVIRPVSDVFDSDAAYRRFLLNLLIERNVVFNESRPIVEFSLDSGHRVSLIRGTVGDGNPVTTIRRHRLSWHSLDTLAESGFCDAAAARWLRRQVSFRRNCFISGQTSTGKTTLLCALLRELPDAERLVLIEDTREIQLRAGQNAVHLQTRRARYAAAGVEAGDLIKAALRMRPDRIILGEVRREEAVQFLHALNTGHQGSLCTGHAQSGPDMVHRLLLLLVEAGIPTEAARKMLGRSIDCMVHLTRINGKRCIEALLERRAGYRWEVVAHRNHETGTFIWNQVAASSQSPAIHDSGLPGLRENPAACGGVCDFRGCADGDGWEEAGYLGTR